MKTKKLMMIAAAVLAAFAGCVGPDAGNVAETAAEKPLRVADVLFGLAIGVPNYFSARFLLLSLGKVPAVVAYPSFSVGTIILVALAGVMLFREKISKRKAAALGIILISLALLNL